MTVGASLEEIWCIKEKISSEIAEMSHEEIIRYFREKRPPEIGPLPRLDAVASTTVDTENETVQQ